MLKTKMGKKGAKSTTAPKSRWPEDAKTWNGAKRAEHARKIEKNHPKEDPEYGMPDGSEE